MNTYILLNIYTHIPSYTREHIHIYTHIPINTNTLHSSLIVNKIKVRPHTQISNTDICDTYQITLRIKVQSHYIFVTMKDVALKSENLIIHFIPMLLEKHDHDYCVKLFAISRCIRSSIDVKSKVS